MAKLRFRRQTRLPDAHWQITRPQPNREKPEIMTSKTAQTLSVLRLLPKAALIMLVLSAPVLAVPSLRADTGSTIEAPQQKKTGMGFVLLVSLQRS